MLKDNGRIIFDMLAQENALLSVRQLLHQSCFARLDGLPPHVSAFKLDKIEGIEQDRPIVPAVPQRVDIREAIVFTIDRLAIDQE